MPSPEPLETLSVLALLARCFEMLGLSYFVGGSVASSLYGMFRATNDIDLIVDLPETKIDALVAALQEEFYIDADMIREAQQSGLSFNVIHLATMIKADLFPARKTAFDLSKWSRRRQEQIPPMELDIYVASPEDMVLQKLIWYRLTGERSDRQWGDVQGILKVQADALDFAYMQHWAQELDLNDLLATSLTDAGLDANAE